MGLPKKNKRLPFLAPIFLMNNPQVIWNVISSKEKAKNTTDDTRLCCWEERGGEASSLFVNDHISLEKKEKKKSIN